jgi:hypothetical protein
MLEVINAPDHVRQGEAKMDYASAYQGYITYIKGVDAEGTILLSCPYDSAQSAKCYYPVKKYRMEEDLSDTSDAVDKLPKGSRVVYYEGGEFWTDKFSRNSFSLGYAIPAATAESRGLSAGFYQVQNIMMHSVLPNTGLYVNWSHLHRGMLTATAVGSAGAPPAVKKFRMIEIYLASAAQWSRVFANKYGTALKLRFKIVPGYVGESF